MTKDLKAKFKQPVRNQVNSNLKHMCNQIHRLTKISIHRRKWIPLMMKQSLTFRAIHRMLVQCWVAGVIWAAILRNIH